jgi:hypothetical protein
MACGRHEERLESDLSDRSLGICLSLFLKILCSSNPSRMKRTARDSRELYSFICRKKIPFALVSENREGDQGLSDNS